jgi:hypothetical protein
MQGLNATHRPRAQGLFKRAYDFELDAAGLKGVPIQVWTSKSFTASWHVTTAAPPITATLRHVPDRSDDLTGEITNQLGVPLEDAGLFFGGRWYALEGPLTGTTRITLEGRPRQEVQRWARAAGRPGEVPGSGGRWFDPTQTVKQLLFHDKIDTAGNVRNNALRPLDLSWRVRDDFRPNERATREAILVGRLARAAGKAEGVTGRPESPSRLWLGDLPGPGKTRPALDGDLVQYTYVRVIIPVPAAEAKAP